MGKKRVFLYGAALVLAGCVGLAGFRLASGQELYKAPELTLLEGQADFDLLEGIEYDAGQYELRVDDLGEFDVNRLGEYWVGYVLTPKAGEQGELLPVAQAAEVPDADPVSPLDGDPEPPVEPQDPGAAETEPPVEPQDPGAVETEPPVESQDPDAVETELPLETPEPETVRFQRRVSVISAINEYKETIRMVLGAPVEAAAGGITAKPGSDNYDITVALDGFNPNEVGEYRVTYILTRRDTGAKLRDFQRWVQVTKPDVDFTVDEEPLVAPAKPETAEAEFWLSGITYDETRYTLVLRDDPAALIPNWAEPQRLVYELWEGDPNVLPAGDAAPAMYADPSAGDIGPSAGDGILPAGDGAQPTPELAAVFGRDVYTTGEMEEEPKESEKPEERKLAIVAPTLVINLADLDPDNPQPINLLDGVEVIDEATGDPVVDAVVAVSNPGELADAVVDNTGGGGLLNGGMGDPGMDGPGPGAGDPVPEEPENTGYNILDPTALTEGEYEVELAAADPETGELITGVRAVSVQPRVAGDLPAGFCIGFSDPGSYDTTNGVVWIDNDMSTGSGDQRRDCKITTLKQAIEDFKTVLQKHSVSSSGHFTFYLFGRYTLTNEDVQALKNFTFNLQSTAGVAGTAGWVQAWQNGLEIRYHNAGADSRLVLNSGVQGLELPTGITRDRNPLPQGFYWNIETTRDNIKYITGTGQRLTMEPREYGTGYLVLTGGPKAGNMSNGASYSQGSNMTYQGRNMSGQTGNSGPQHKVASGLLFVNPTAAGTVTNSGALNLTVNNNSNMDLDVCAGHAMIHAAYGPPAFIVQQSGTVTVTMNGSTGTPDVYLGFSNQRANPKVKLTNGFTINLSGGARLGNIYPNRMSCNNGGDYDGEITVQTPNVNINGNVTVTGGIYGFSKVIVNANNTLNCGRLDYSLYGYNSGNLWGELVLNQGSRLTLTNRDDPQRVGFLAPKGSGTTLAVPTANNNNTAPNPLQVLKTSGAQDITPGREITLEGSDAGYTGGRGHVMIKFTDATHANNVKERYRLGSRLTNVESVEVRNGEVYLNSDDRWQAYYEANGSYQFLGNYLTLGNALNAMKSDAAANSTHRVWRLNMLMDYTLNDNDRNTMSTLQLQNVDRVTLEGKTADGVRKKFTAVGTNFLLFPQGNGTGTEYVMRDFTWNDSGKSAIVANGSKLIIEGQWSGTENCHVAGGGGSVHAEGDESQKTVTHNGATDVTVRNTGSGWASIVGGNLLLKGGSKNVSATSIVNGATRVTVDASWPIGLGISPGCLCLGYDCDITLAAGGSATITGNLQKGSYTSNFNGNRVIQGHITHFGFTDTNRLKTFTADADVSINLGSGAAALSITGSLPVNVAEVNVWPWDFLSTTNTVGDRAYPKGSGRLIVSVNNDLTLASGTQIKTFDELRVAAGKTLTFGDHGGNVNYNGKVGNLVLGEGSTVVLQTQSTGNNNNALKLGGITLNGTSTLSFPQAGNIAWAPVRVTKNDGQLTANGHKLTVTYNPNGNAAHGDAVLELVNQTNAEATMSRLTPNFTNGAAFLRDGGVIRVDRELIAVDYVDANGHRAQEGHYMKFPSIKEAIDQFVNVDPYGENWRISLMKNYTLTKEDVDALKDIGSTRLNGSTKKMYLAGRRDVGSSALPINTLTLGATNEARILRLPDGALGGTEFILKDFNVAGGTGAIVANGRKLTIEGAWSGNGWWYVAGGAADWYEGTGNATLTYNGTTNLTVRNTGTGWGAIAGGNLIARGNGGAEQPAAGTASSEVTGATNLTVNADNWGTHYGITPGCLYIGCDVGTTTLTAGGTATLTGRVTLGHISHFAAADRGAVGACELGGNSVINLGSAAGGFTIGSNAEMNVKSHGAITGGELILSVDGDCTVEDGSNVMKTFDELRVSANKTLTFMGDGGWIKYNSHNNDNRQGLLVLEDGSTLKLSRIGSYVDSALHVKGIQLNGNASLQYPRMNGKTFAPVVVDSGGTLTADNTSRKLTVSYTDATDAQVGDCLLYFVTETNAAQALPYVQKGFRNADDVALVLEDGVIKVGKGSVLLTHYDGTYGQYFPTLAAAVNDMQNGNDKVPEVLNSGHYRTWARITFVEDYTLTQEDVTALENYKRAGQGNKTNGALISRLKLTSQFVAGGTIPAPNPGGTSWPVLNYPTPTGTTDGTSVRRTVTIPASIDTIKLGITNNEWENLTLRFEGDDTEIFVRGWQLEVLDGVTMEGTHFPTLYGGDKDDVFPYGAALNGIALVTDNNGGGNVGITLNSGTWKAVYGGGKNSGADVPGNVFLTINGARLAAGGAVYGGGKVGAVTGNTNVTITSGTAVGGAQGIKIVAGGETGDVRGTARLTVNGGVSSSVITLKGVESGTANDTNINVSLDNLPQTASLVTLNVYAGPETTMNNNDTGLDDDAPAGSGSVTHSGTVSISFGGTNRPNLGTVCGLLERVNRQGTNNNTSRSGNLTLKGSMTAKEIIFFDNLHIGENANSTGTVTVTGRLDSDPNKNIGQDAATRVVRRWAFERDGTLFVHGATRLNLPDAPSKVLTGTPNNETGEAKVGYLKTDSTEAHVHIGRVKLASDGTGRATGDTNPLYVSLGNTTVDKTSNKLRVGTPNGTPENRELLIVFPGSLTGGNSPSKGHYTTDTTDWLLGEINPWYLTPDQRSGAYVNVKTETIAIIYTKSAKMEIEVVSVTPTRAEDASNTDPIGWEVKLRLRHYVQDGNTGDMVLDTIAPEPHSVYVDNNPDADTTWAADWTKPGTQPTNLAWSETFKDGSGGAEYITTLTISGQTPFEYVTGTPYYYVHGKGANSNGTESVRSIALDLHAPQLIGDVSATGNGRGVTEFTIAANDVMPKNAPPGVVDADGETHSQYNMSHLTLMGWSTENLGDNPGAVTQTHFEDLQNGRITDHTGGLLFYDARGVQSETRKTFTVDNAKLPADTDWVYVYLKDSLGNTRIHAVPLSKYQVDLTIPTRVGVILVTNGTHTLSPVCHITNNSQAAYVKADLVGYTDQRNTNEHILGTPTAANNIIGLAIGGSGEADSIGGSINVQDLPWRAYTAPPTDSFTNGTPQELGILGPLGGTNADHTPAVNTLSFKFQGNFTTTTNLSTRWNLFYLTYRFTVTTDPTAP